MTYAIVDYNECVSIETGRMFLEQIKMSLLLFFIVPLIQILEFLMRN